MITCPWEQLAGLSVGDCVMLHGKRYIISRKGTSSAVVSRYYWFDVVRESVIGWLWPR